jgi:hypothetical protein
MKTSALALTLAILLTPFSTAADQQDDAIQAIGSDPATADSNQPSRPRKQRALFALTGNFWVHPEMQIKSSPRDTSAINPFSGGLSLIGEGYVLPFLTVGVLLNTTAVASIGATGNDQLSPTVSVDLTTRALLPLGSRRQFEIYLRVAVGYTVLIPTEKVGAGGSTWTEIQHGWNVMLLPGFLYRTKSGVAFMAELGWVGAGYLDSLNGTDFTLMVHSPSLNIGIGYSF